MKLALALPLAVCALTACGSTTTEASPDGSGDDKPAAPVAKLAPIASDALCVTKGAAAMGERVTAPTMRAIARGTAGDAAALTFTFRGDSDDTIALANGKPRRQLGLKLRAQNGCNLVYVMWRLDPKPKLDISIKVNRGAKTHEQCGADGYKKLKPRKASRVPALRAGATHTLRAEIIGDELYAWIDDKLAWRGRLPSSARTLTGPVGLRSDNLAFDLVLLSAAPGDPSAPAPKCVTDESD